MRKFFLLLVFVVGCSVPKETIIEDREIPVRGFDIQSIRHDTLYLPADTARILEMYCKGEAVGSQDGVDWKVKYHSTFEGDLLLKQKDSLSRVNNWYQKDRGRLIKELEVAIHKRDTTASYKDTTIAYRPIIQEYGFWDKVGLVLIGVGVTTLLFGIGFLASKFGFLKL